MSEVLEFGGRRFVAGLYWVQPGAEVDRSARRARAWSVDWGEQTGWVPKEAGLRGVEGVPSLAASLAAYLPGSGGDGPESGWVALLKADNGRFALVRVRDGVIGAGGDEVFDEAATAIHAMSAARADGAEVYGTADAVTDGVFLDVDVSALPEGEGEAGLKRGSGGTSGLRVAGLCLALVLLGVGAVAALAPDMLFGLFGGRDKAVLDVTSRQEAEVSARIDSGALVQACGAAQAEWLPYMPAWQRSSIACHGWFGEPELVGLRPELEGRAVMLVRWDLPGHYVAALHRRIAEEHLAAWYLASVVETSAWAVVPLGPVLGHADAQPALSYLAFRREVDRHLGMQGASIDYDEEPNGVEVTVGLGHGLGRIAQLVADIPGFEVVSLSQSGRGQWVLKARPVTGFLLKEGLFRQLAGNGSGREVASF